MATRTKSRQSDRSSSNRSSSAGSNRSSNERSAFSWGESGPIIAAALGGAALGFAANYGRKFITQAVSGISGDWDEVLATEHDLALAVFDKMLATDSSQTWKRSMLLMQLTHMLDKHAHEEEMVVYPALREADQAVEADQLNAEHGYIKTFLYELGKIGPDASNWLEKVREFRVLVAEHAKMEEGQVFPAFKRNLDEEQNAKITALVNKDGFWAA
ncbi:hemerythrin domain-containing protein [Sphingomonas segetis]|jgi:hemerythrin superfamily protein|uniref:hemerythrin domain-containing protein n=1 Tax=Sphingomonas segetis TaxID=1104779 RepID=UPI0012D333A3|nr:hemerythrin domain-containing protein [Sphingomonas segetis]